MAPRSKPESVTKEELDKVDRWFDGDKAAAQAFQDSLDAGGIIRSDLIKVAAAMDGVMENGLTRECLVLLIQDRCPNMRNGRPMPRETVNQVLSALCKLREYVRPEFLPKKVGR